AAEDAEFGGRRARGPRASDESATRVSLSREPSVSRAPRPLRLSGALVAQAECFGPHSSACSAPLRLSRAQPKTTMLWWLRATGSPPGPKIAEDWLVYPLWAARTSASAR